MSKRTVSTEHVLELRQSRDLTVAECGGTAWQWGSLLREKAGKDRFYGIAVTALYGCLAFLLISLVRAIQVLDTVQPQAALQLTLAAIGAAGCVVLVQWRMRRAQARNLDQFRAGDRYFMTGDGLRREVPGGFGLIGWPSIAGILSSAERLTILTDRGGALILTKAAFTGQDVEAFGAELRRRWSAARDGAAPILG
jgi:hypothetical protein